jgi:hypothetical protein
VTSVFYPAPSDLLPWITRRDGVWTGREYPTAEQARAAEPDAEVWPDQYVVGPRPFGPNQYAEPIPRETVKPAWTPDYHLR